MYFPGGQTAGEAPPSACSLRLDLNPSSSFPHLLLHLVAALSNLYTVGRYCRLLSEPISHAQGLSRAEYSNCGVRVRCEIWTTQLMRDAPSSAKLGNTSCSVDFSSVKIQSAADYYAKIYIPLRGCFAERPLSVMTYRTSLAVCLYHRSSAMCLYHHHDSLALLL